MEEMAKDRAEAIGRANMEAEATAAASVRGEADRLLEEHRDRTAQLQEEMKVRSMHMHTPEHMVRNCSFSCQMVTVNSQLKCDGSLYV